MEQKLKTKRLVNNPLRYQNIDFYKSDWNLLGIRIKDDATSNKIYEVRYFL